VLEKVRAKSRVRRVLVVYKFEVYRTALFLGLRLMAFNRSDCQIQGCYPQ